jgi:hypothetical protein
LLLWIKSAGEERRGLDFDVMPGLHGVFFRNEKEPLVWSIVSVMSQPNVGLASKLL